MNMHIYYNKLLQVSVAQYEW